VEIKAKMKRQDCNYFTNTKAVQWYHLSHGNWSSYRTAHQLCKEYREALNRLDVNKAPDITWPVSPDI